MPDLHAPILAACAALPLSDSVTPDQARLSRLLCRGVQTGLDAAGPGTRIELQIADVAALAWADSLTLSGPFGAIECADGARLLRALTGIDPGQASDDEPHGAWLGAAIIGRLAGTPFARVTRLTRGMPAPIPDAATLRLTVRSSTHALMVHARASAQTWFAFMQGYPWTPVRAPAEEFFNLPTKATIRIARHTLPSHLLRTLADGDIVLPDSAAFSCDGTGSVRLGHLAARVRYQAPGFLHVLSTEIKLDTEDYDDDDERFDDDDFDEPHSPAQAGAAVPTAPAPVAGDNTHESDEQYNDDAAGTAADAATPDDAVEQVPVVLEFLLGKVRLTLGELRSLAPGAVVTLDDGSPYVIQIRSGGRTLGQGEAVDVDGRLGIRITRWGAQR
jgi:type III secretion protein Q